MTTAPCDALTACSPRRLPTPWCCSVLHLPHVPQTFPLLSAPFVSTGRMIKLIIAKRLWGARIEERNYCAANTIFSKSFRYCEMTLGRGRVYISCSISPDTAFHSCHALFQHGRAVLGTTGRFFIGLNDIAEEAAEETDVAKRAHVFRWTDNTKRTSNLYWLKSRLNFYPSIQYILRKLK